MISNDYFNIYNFKYWLDKYHLVKIFVDKRQSRCKDVFQDKTGRDSFEFKSRTQVCKHSFQGEQLHILSYCKIIGYFQEAWTCRFRKEGKDKSCQAVRRWTEYSW